MVRLAQSTMPIFALGEPHTILVAMIVIDKKCSRWGVIAIRHDLWSGELVRTAVACCLASIISIASWKAQITCPQGPASEPITPLVSPRLVDVKRLRCRILTFVQAPTAALLAKRVGFMTFNAEFVTQYLIRGELGACNECWFVSLESKALAGVLACTIEL